METAENQSVTVQSPAEPTAMPMIAGIMAIIAGAFKLFSLLVVAGVFFFIPVSSVHADVGRMEIITIMLIVMIPLIALGVLSIIGGIDAIRRQRYGMALTGAIAALLPFSMLGIASVILVALSKNEFA